MCLCETETQDALWLGLWVSCLQYSAIWQQMNLKFSKLTWNQELHISGFNAKFWTFWHSFIGQWEYRTYKIIVVDLFFFFCNWKFLTSISIEVSLENHTKKEKNKLRHHNIISMVCTLIDRSFYPMSLQEIAQLNCEKTFYTVHVSVQQVFSVVQNVCLVHHVHSGYPFPLQFFLLSFPMNSCFRELKREGSFEGCLPTVIEPFSLMISGAPPQQWFSVSVKNVFGKGNIALIKKFLHCR